MAISQNLEDMKLSELKDLAKQMGLRGTSTMRKSDLVSTLTAARNGGEAPAGVTVRVPANPIRSKQSYSNDFARDSYLSRVDDTRGADTKSEDTKSEENHSFDSAHRMQRHSNDSNDASTRDVNRGSDESSSSDGSRFRDRAAKGRRRREFSRDARIDSRDESKNLNREENRDLARISKKNDDTVSSKDSSVVDLDQILATLPNELDEAQSGSRTDSNYDVDSRRQRSSQREDSARGDRFQRRMRARTRDFDDTQSIHVDRNLDRSSERDEDRSSERDEDLRDREVRDSHDLRDQREQADRQSSRVEPQEELVPVAGIVDVLESYAFIRTSGYLPGPNDVYVSMSQIKKYGLRKGDAVQGSIRAPRDGDRRSQRQKFVPLQSIDTINGLSVEAAQTRPQFAKLTPLYPQERLKQETTPNRILGRIIDLVAPIGKGQRGLIVSPPKAGKTITLQNIANAIAVNNPEVHLMVVLVDERPEEVTDMERTVQGEVISSTFDRPATDHTTVAELAIERAKRLVELGQDVVVLLDSMTRLARAYNIAAPTSGRILSGGVDAQALYPPKKFFGAARNIENGGSLTIISSALVETGSKMDEVIFEEFKGTGNMELRLSRDLADKRLFPAVDINSSGTRREELITSAQELPIIYRLRRLFGGLEPEQAYQTLVPRLKKTASNRDFLSAIVQQANNSTNGGTAQSAA
ncbi:transcription termination factor Rho [Gardnerella sp. KA00735]|uniref:transcription termination factor Rho n=1 Tax=Gardnerella sp. KA00735 TaxID=1973156 RepID=UPI000C9F98FD|nr:transcription termination factor Rho [Gardnerella sp. KA00735]PNP88704.1 transcription termination factor Rho [Gardnerella sp. KA00735]